MIINELLQRTISMEEGLLVLKKQLQVSILKGKYQNEWSGKVEPEYRDEVLDKIYECMELLKKLKSKRVTQDYSRRPPDKREQNISEPVKRPDYSEKRGSPRKYAKIPGQLQGSFTPRTSISQKVDKARENFQQSVSREDLDDDVRIPRHYNRQDSSRDEMSRIPRQHYSRPYGGGSKDDIEEASPQYKRRRSPVDSTRDEVERARLQYKSYGESRRTYDMEKTGRSFSHKESGGERRIRGKPQPASYYRESLKVEEKDLREESPGEEEFNGVALWGQFFETASTSLVGGTGDEPGNEPLKERSRDSKNYSGRQRGENREIPVEKAKLKILDKLPVGKFSTSELSPGPAHPINEKVRLERSKRGKSFIKPDVLVDLLESEKEPVESIFLPGSEELSIEGRKDIYGRHGSRQNYHSAKPTRAFKKPFGTLELNSDISTIPGLSPISTGLRDGLYSLVWGELFNISLRLDLIRRNPCGGKSYSELYFINLSRYAPVEMNL